MHQLSVIIVNYNVRYFLDQCLASVYKACANIDAEVWVVDNNSTDDSLELVAEKYPQTKIIANKDNKGFSYANNQAIKLSDAKYVLLLNPDTVVGEDTFEKTINFFDTTPDCGGLTVRMIDGKGNFLPESKRGLPTPDVAFYKIFGLSSLFPKSKIFGKYHLSYLNEYDTHQIDVLSGAYMMMRSKTLDEVGLLDESFFMYGEDIDLSYRITQGGYKNYYYPHTKIIHYKGESTKKSSINYVFVFYKAMIIFANKHFASKSNRFFSAAINIAIYMRAFLAIGTRLVNLLAHPIFDALAITIAYLLTQLLLGSSPSVFSVLILSFLYYSLAYIYKPNNSTLTFYGFGKLLIWISFLHLCMQVALSLSINSIWVNLVFVILTSLILLSVKRILRKIPIEHFSFKNIAAKNVVLVGTDREIENAFSIANQSYEEVTNTIFIKTDYNTFDAIAKQLKEIATQKKFNEIIFCSKHINFMDMIATMEILKKYKIEYKILPYESNFIIGSNSIYIKNLLIPATKQLTSLQVLNKRIADIALSLCMLVLHPFLKNNTKTYKLKDIIAVLFNTKTWVVFFEKSHKQYKNGIFTPIDIINQGGEVNLKGMNNLYLQNYSPLNDIVIAITCIISDRKKN